MAKSDLPPQAPANDELGPASAKGAALAQQWPVNEQALEEAESWLIQLQSPDLCQAKEHEFFQWLQASPANQAAYIQAEQLWYSLGHSLGQSQHQGLASLKLASTVNNTKPKASRKGWLGLALAASLCLALLLPSFGGGEHSFKTATGEQLQLNLADGSKVQLNTRTELEVALEAGQRMLELDYGEAYFDVHSDPERPFIVKTPAGFVRVLGTRFNIYTDTHKTEVTVIEGKVDVSTGRALGELAQLDFSGNNLLTANQQIQLQHLPKNKWLSLIPGQQIPAKRGEVVQVNGDDVLAWQRGEAIYNGTQLAAVIADLNRYYPGQIRLQDEARGTDEVVAALRLDDKQAALEALANSFALDIVTLANGDVVLK
ncbi:MAG: FecR domain-containing protein [Cellvibrionaceae bacterium]|nr:FecR domain-containing protein [Cellvibrionaceae bacterium]